MFNISTTPDGVFANRSWSSLNVPVCATSFAFSAVLFPMPGCALNSSSEASSMRKGNLSNLKDALAIAFVRNGFSL
ncbi:hypothetical protein D3C80_1807990 [compost metagenome]